ncbi:MAG: hypothetical protein ACREPS_04835 [Rhodanobacteraceae bacterium]
MIASGDVWPDVRDRISEPVGESVKSGLYLPVFADTGSGLPCPVDHPGSSVEQALFFKGKSKTFG